MKGLGKILLSLTIICVVSCQKKEDDFGAGIDTKLMLRLINEQRTAGCKCGDTDMPPAPAVQWNRLLAKAAYGHSVDMNTHRTLNHTSFDGRSPDERIKATGYNPDDWAENIAADYSNEQSVIKAWMQSQGHCANIMNKNFTEVGVGRKANYWTMVLARPR